MSLKSSLQQRFGANRHASTSAANLSNAISDEVTNDTPPSQSLNALCEYTISHTSDDNELQFRVKVSWDKTIDVNSSFNIERLRDYVQSAIKSCTVNEGEWEGDPNESEKAHLSVHTGYALSEFFHENMRGITVYVPEGKIQGRKWWSTKSSGGKEKVRQRWFVVEPGWRDPEAVVGQA